jgi:hypothetical protein
MAETTDLIDAVVFLFYGVIALTIVLIISIALQQAFAPYIKINIFGYVINALAVMGDGLVLIYLMMNFTVIYGLYHATKDSAFAIMSVIGLLAVWVVMWVINLIYAQFYSITAFYNILLLYLPLPKLVFMYLPIITIFVGFVALMALSKSGSGL